MPGASAVDVPHARSNPVLAVLDPAIGYPHQFENDAIPLINHQMQMAGWAPGATRLDRCVRYVNSQGLWYYILRLVGDTRLQVASH